MFIDLNTITKEEFAEALLVSEDAEPFYYPREDAILNLTFDFEELKEEFEQWMLANSDTVI